MSSNPYEPSNSSSSSTPAESSLNTPPPSYNTDLSSTSTSEFNPSTSQIHSRPQPKRPQTPQAGAPTIQAAERGSPSLNQLTSGKQHSHPLSHGHRQRTVSLSPTGKKMMSDRTGILDVFRAMVGRLGRMIRRGNLIFLLLFLSCTIIFFSALSGIGYVEPNPESSDTQLSYEQIEESEITFQPPPPKRNGVGSFRPPSYEGLTPQQLRRMEEQRKLEEMWVKKKRPKDGDWMQKARDDRAVRRIRPQSTEPDGSQERQIAEAEGDGDDSSQGLRKRRLGAQETGEDLD